MERLRPYFTRLYLSKLINETRTQNRDISECTLDVNNLLRCRESAFPGHLLRASTERTSNINEGRGPGMRQKGSG